jgi:hypothetical protein
VITGIIIYCDCESYDSVVDLEDESLGSSWSLWRMRV